MQFSIHSAFLMIFAVAVYFAMAQTAGYVVAIVLVAAACLLIFAICWPRRGKLAYFRIALSIVAVVVIWFAAVDWHWSIGHCSVCWSCRDKFQYRLLGIPISTRFRERRSTLQLALTDLCVPCAHEQCKLNLVQRHWGLLICECPCDRSDVLGEGVYDEDYTAAASIRLREVAFENPQLAAELYDLAIRKNDYRVFWHRVDALTKASESFPPVSSGSE
jgi:hypothetical protein